MCHGQKNSMTESGTLTVQEGAEVSGLFGGGNGGGDYTLPTATASAPDAMQAAGLMM